MHALGPKSESLTESELTMHVVVCSMDVHVQVYTDTAFLALRNWFMTTPTTSCELVCWAREPASQPCLEGATTTPARPPTQTQHDMKNRLRAAGTNEGTRRPSSPGAVGPVAVVVVEVVVVV